MAIASAAFSINGEAVGVKASVSAGGSIVATLDSLTGVDSVAWSIASTDETTSTASYTITPSGTKGSVGTTTALTAGTGGLMKCVVNGGIDPITGSPDTVNLIKTVKFYVPTSGGLEVGVAGEEYESDATFGSVGIINAPIRALASLTSPDYKAAARAATTANIANLASVSTTLDGLTLVEGDRVLVKDQTTATQNGIYVVGTVGGASAPFTRATDNDSSAEMNPGLTVYVAEGTANAETYWTQTTPDPITLGSTNIVFEQKLGAGVSTATTLTAGAGLTGGGDLSANRTFDVVANGDGSIVVNANDIQVGVLASDAQHGTRGGGTTHANAIASGAAGFMTGTDKQKLDDATSSATASKLAIRDGSSGFSVEYIATSGTNPASAGGVRLANDQQIMWRNAANSANIGSLYVDGSDQCRVGTGSTNLIFLTNGDIYPTVNSVYWRDSSSNICALQTNSITNWSWVYSNNITTSIAWSHTQLGGTGSANGVPWSVTTQPGQAQTGANDNTNGGKLTLGTGAAGTGGSGAAGVAGTIALKLGATEAVSLIDDATNSTWLLQAEASRTFQIEVIDEAADEATASGVTVHGSDGTGTNARGGPAVLSGGTGTGQGGDAGIYAGNGAGKGGIAYVTAGDSTSSGAGGDVYVGPGDGVGTNQDAGHIYLLTGAATGTGVETNVEFFGANADWGGGANVISINDAAVVPTTNPTASFLMYSEGGAGKARSQRHCDHFCVR